MRHATKATKKFGPNAKTKKKKSSPTRRARAREEPSFQTPSLPRPLHRPPNNSMFFVFVFVFQKKIPRSRFIAFRIASSVFLATLRNISGVGRGGQPSPAISLPSESSLSLSLSFFPQLGLYRPVMSAGSIMWLLRRAEDPVTADMKVILRCPAGIMAMAHNRSVAFGASGVSSHLSESSLGGHEGLLVA